MAIVIKSPAEIRLMREAGRIVARVLDALQERIRPGLSTAELDRVAEEVCTRLGGIPAFKGYGGFPASLCVSINHEVVHGIPSPHRFLEEGDIVSLDFGAIYRGFHGDAAVTVAVGQPSPAAANLIAVTREALARAIAQCVEGKRIGDIGWAIQSYVESRKLYVVRQYVGHGIGRQLHEDPQVPNFGVPGRGIRLRRGFTLAIEPMVNIGTDRTVVAEDGWTVLTEDGSLSAHFEHTVAITPDGPEVLTLP